MGFEEYATRNLRILLATARAICGGNAQAEDVLQDVLIKIQARWDLIGGMDARDAYIRRMLINEFISWHRKWSRLIPHAEPRRDDSLPDETAAIVERDSLLTDIARLPPRQRAVIGLKYFADLTDEQIAHDLGCSLSTVRTHTSRALASLRINRTPQINPTERSAELC